MRSGKHYNRRDEKDAPDCLTIEELVCQGRVWRLAGEAEQRSRGTLAQREYVIGRLRWFLCREGYETVGALELRAFFAYLATAHERPEGRWDQARRTEPLRPAAMRFYHNYLASFCRWLIAEGAVGVDLMARIPPPGGRPEAIVPLSSDQIHALLAAARRSWYRPRDETLILFLLDTGCRASEACAVRRRDLDMETRAVTVLGKGNRRRRVHFGIATARALWSILREREPDRHLFLSESGATPGEPLTRSGLAHILRRLGREAGITGVRCSPHTLRHTFAVRFLSAGGNVFALQQLLGHADLSMTRRYCALAETDLADQHRAFSPVDRLRGR